MQAVEACGCLQTGVQSTSVVAHIDADATQRRCVKRRFTMFGSQTLGLSRGIRISLGTGPSSVENEALLQFSTGVSIILLPSASESAKVSPLDGGVLVSMDARASGRLDVLQRHMRGDAGHALVERHVDLPARGFVTLQVMAWPAGTPACCSTPSMDATSSPVSSELGLPHHIWCGSTSTSIGCLAWSPSWPAAGTHV